MTPRARQLGVACLWVGLVTACGSNEPTNPGPSATDAENTPEPAPSSEPSPAELDPSWGKGCVDTNPAGCVQWGLKARRLGEDYEPFLEPTCTGGDGYACQLLADFRRKDGASWDDVMPLYERACTFGTGDACGRMATQTEGDERQALLEKGCALRCAPCCVEAGLPVPEK